MCYIDAMISKNLAIAAALVSVMLLPPACAAQTSDRGAAARRNRVPAAVPAAPPAASNSAQASAPSAPAPSAQPANPSVPGSENPIPHISIATPAPAPTPWTLPERIRWMAEIVVAVFICAGIYLAFLTLRRIERQSHYAETAAQAAADAAKAALVYAEAQAQQANSQAQMDRPWLLVTADPAPGAPDTFNIVLTNRGRSPARIVSLIDEIASAPDDSQLPPTPVFNGEAHAPRAPIILLPGESTGIKSFSRSEVPSVCESPEQLQLVEAWNEKIYLYGIVSYFDMRYPDQEEAHETSWCCWYIHGRQRSGMVMAGPPEYNRHT